MTVRTTYADVRVVLDYPVERIWPQLADFGALAQWGAGVTGCTVAGEGPGAIRTVSLGERSVRERLEMVDEAGFHLRYQILPPHGLPAADVFSEISLAALDEGRTELRWRSEATGFAVPPERLGAGIEAFYRRSIVDLCRLLGGLSGPHGGFTRGAA